MRKKLALALAAAFAGGVVGTAAAESRYCDPVLSEVFGRCTNACYEVRRISGKPMNCPA